MTKRAVPLAERRNQLLDEPGADTSPENEVHDHDSHHGAIASTDLIRIALILLVATLLWFRLWDGFGHLRLVGLAATLAGGYPIFKEAFENMRQRRMTMELSMTIALVAALAIGEEVTALVITGFVLAAEILEGLTVSRGRRAIGQLLDLLPRVVWVRRHEQVMEIPIQELRSADLVLVRPGSRIPVDGTVVSGESFVDQAAITGEPMPVQKRAGSAVLAGTVNQSGALEVRGDRIGRDTSFGRIIDAVEHAEHRRAPIQKTADRLAGYLVYFAAGAAAVTFLVTRDVRSTISVIIVAGACGVAAGTPLAILGAIGRAARAGAIIKGGVHLEALWAIDTVVLDKTGTVTFGDARVRAVYPAAGASARRLLEAAAIAEFPSEHPIGRAIIKHASDQGLSAPEPTEFSYRPGHGVRAVYAGEEILVGTSDFVTASRLSELPRDVGSSTMVFVIRGGQYLGGIAVDDVPRPEAGRAVAEMRSLGLKTVLLTGDSRSATELIAWDLGVDSFETDLLPEAKLARVEALCKTRKVAMIGDGINDAPALVAATVGVAMGSGTDVARESADIVLIGNNLLKFVDTVRLARRTRGVILQNFVGTVIVDGAGIALAAAGALTPLLAAVIHVTSELVFVLNAARLVSADDIDLTGRRVSSARERA
jgi:heavy metal translocating P-type ATPase